MTLRTWATPLITATFVVTAVSGVMLFFHVRSSGITFSHIWLGWAMLAAVALHLWLNWRPFVLYFKRPIPATIMATGLVVLGLMFTPIGSNIGIGGETHGGGATAGGGGNSQKIAVAVGNAHLSTLAELAGKSTDEVIAVLTAQGITGVNLNDTAASLSGGDRERQNEIIMAVLAK